MPDTAAAILSRYGLVNTDAIVAAAVAEGLDIAAAATMISKESGGRNIWGADGVSTGGVYTKNGPVTKENYLAYRSLVRAGKIGRQGVGPAQCTSAGYQDTADALGGCWEPVANMRSGFRGLNRLIRSYGIQDGARRYNGSGPAAEAYGRDFLSRYTVWKGRLAGAALTTSQEDALTPEEHDMLTRVHEQLLTTLKPWAGGVSDKEPPDGISYNLFQYLLRTNVEAHQCWAAVKRLEDKLDKLLAG